jgi:FkbM family methyltransferase
VAKPKTIRQIIAAELNTSQVQHEHKHEHALNSNDVAHFSFSMMKKTSDLAGAIGRQQWIRFGIRDRIIRRFDDPELTAGVDFIQDFYGGTYAGNTKNFIDWNVRYYGSYSGAELTVFTDCIACLDRQSSGSVPEQPGVLDIGANIGHHALYYALTGATGIAFEPNPHAASAAAKKLDSNHIKDFRIEQVALSDKFETLPLFLPAEDGKSSIASLRRENIDGSKYILVDVVPGDSYQLIKELPRLDYIKIDVEGHELPVLAGLKCTLQRWRPFVFLEWNCKASFDQIIRVFPCNYSFWAFLPDSPKLFIFNTPGYRLAHLGDSVPDRAMNLLAVPHRQLPPRLARCQVTSAYST